MIWRCAFTLLATALLLCWSAPSAAGQLKYTQSFDSLKPGSDGAPAVQALAEGWRMEKGRYLQTAGEGRYDLAATLPPYLRGRYTLSVRIRHASSYIGAGVVFGLGARDSIAFGHMVRFDGPQELLYGHFYRGQFEAAGRLLVPVAVAAEAWNTLRIDADEATGRYAVRVDEQIVGEDLALSFGSGYAGLQASNCNVAFDNFRTEVLKDLEVAIRWPQRFAVCKSGIVHLDPARGALVISQAGSERRLTQGVAHAFAREFRSFASGSGGRFAALDASRSQLLPFDPRGRNLKPIPIPETIDPVDVGIDAERRYHLLGRDGELLVLDSRGERQAHGKPPGERVAGASFTGIAVAPSGTNGIMADTAGRRLVAYELEGERVVFARPIAMSAELRDMVLTAPDDQGRYTLYLALPDRVEARVLTPAGALSNPILSTSHTRLYGRIDPWGLEFGNGGELIVADRAHQRFLRLPVDLRDGSPQPNFASPDELNLHWSTALPSTSAPRYRWFAESGPTEWQAVSATHDGNDHQHSAKLEGLPPLTRMEFEWPRLLDTLPASSEPYKLELWTPAAAGATSFLQLPVLALVYSNISSGPREGEGIAPFQPLSAIERELIAIELREGARGYWINSGMKLWVDLETHFVDDAVTPESLSEDGKPNGMPLAEEIDRRCHAFGKRPTDFAGIVVILATRSWDAQGKTWRLTGRGGGLTIGPDVRGYGLSWWPAPDHQGANAWLFCHEFHHQLDAMFAQVGHPGYWFNHFSPTIGTAERFGEHYDGNAWILRNWPPYLWSALARPQNTTWRTHPFGKLRQSADADGDGVPDQDSSLPLDERSLGSSPAKADSDSDGLSDLQEAMLLIHSGMGGVDQTMGEWAARPAPNHRDADRDGVADGDDPYPLYPLETRLGMGTVAIDGVIDESEYSPVLSMKDRAFEAAVWASWHYDGLAIAFELDRPARVMLMVDGDDDGWFRGRENFRITVDGRNGELKVKVNNCAEPDRWPFETDALIPANTLPYRFERLAEGAFRCELKIPSSAATGFAPGARKKIGVLLGFATEKTFRETRRWVTPFEPHRFVSFELVSSN